jgi:pimeloyl-ACP methyl ester carboxylesterase
MAFLTIDGLRTHVQRLGAGADAIAFVHGLVVDNLSSFYFTLGSPLAAHADILLYDLRGHGKTERPATGYGLERLMADLDAVLAQTHPDRPVYIAGNSFGGLLALAFAARYRRHVRGLILIDPLLPDAGWQRGMVDTLSMTGAEAERSIAEVYKDWHGTGSSRKSSRLATTARALVNDTSLLDDILASPALTEAELTAIDCPTLALYGEGSNILHHADKLGRLLPAASVIRIPGCTHLVLFEGTTALVGHIRDWLAAHADEAGP